MNKVYSILLLLIIALVTLKGYIPYMEYAINQEYISEFLCINKDKPEIICNGKCHLLSQLKKINPESNKNYPFSKSNKETKINYYIPVSNQNIILQKNLNESIPNKYILKSFSNPNIEIPTPPPKSPSS